MNHIFPHDNVVAGVLVFIIGFLFHWAGQMVSVINWNMATRIGLQEDGLPPKYKDYEHAIALSDVLVGIVYLPAAVGLVFNYPWAYKLAWVPGSIFLYHSLNFWFSTGNRRKAGYYLESNSVRIVWAGTNFFAGLLVVAVSWIYV